MFLASKKSTMKKSALFLALICFLSISANAQTKVTERDLEGKWKMVFDFNEKDMKEEIEDSFWLGSLISGPLSSFVVALLEDIDIQMEFIDGGKLKITVEVFGEEDVVYEEWYINSHSELVLGDDDDDEIWMFEDNKLYQYDKKSKGRLEKQQVFLVQR